MCLGGGAVASTALAITRTWLPRPNTIPALGLGRRVLAMAGAAGGMAPASCLGTLPTKPIPSHPGTGAGGGPLGGTARSRLFSSSSLTASLVSPSLCHRNTLGALLAQLGSNV